MNKQNPIAEQEAVPGPRLRVRIFRHSDLWLNRLLKLLTALHEGCWLGWLRADDLNAVTKELYRTSQWYKSTEHNLSGLFDWETAALACHFRPESRILVAGAGAGREVLALRRAGFQAEGFECSPTLLQASQTIFQQLGELDSVTPCAADLVPAGPAIYDGIIVGWGAYTHIPTKQRRIAFLRALRDRALPHSPVLLSFFTREQDSRYEKAVYQTARIWRFVLCHRKETLDRGDRITLGQFVHFFTRDEVEAELRAAGFDLAHFSQENYCHAVGKAA
jgi:hypothetical protein